MDQTDHPHTDPESGNEGAPPSQFNNIVVVITSELLALPFCFSGTEGFMSNDWWKAAKGFGIGLPIGIAGLTFPLWGKYLKRPTQDWIQRGARKWWPVALLAAFLFMTVPDMYDRIASKHPQVVIHDPPSAEDIAKATAAVRSELDSTKRDLAITKEQLDAASQATHTSDTGSPGSINWNTDFMLVVTGGGPNAQINAIIFRGVSQSLVQMKSAYIVSELTGHKQQLLANIPYGGGAVPLDQIESIPAGAIIDLIIEWKPGLSIKDFQDLWGKIFFKAVYNDATYEKHFDEQSIRQKIYREIQGAGGPRVTKKNIS
jgi:hypothetical protein